MRLYLIRHGQSVNNALFVEGRYPNERQYDPELTDKGRQQADCVAQYLADSADMPSHAAEAFRLTHLYCSPMIRALQTAQPIADALGLKPQVWIDIHEIGGLFVADENGASQGFPGLNRAAMQTQFPGYTLLEGITDEGWWDVTKGSEHAADFLARAVRVALALRERADSEDRVALVTHGGFMDALIKALLNQIPTHPDALFFTHYNTGITRIDFGERYAEAVLDRMRLHYHNRVNHLPPDLWTW